VRGKSVVGGADAPVRGAFVTQRRDRPGMTATSEELAQRSLVLQQRSLHVEAAAEPG
jgi:hypothetical protein